MCTRSDLSGEKSGQAAPQLWARGYRDDQHPAATVLGQHEGSACSSVHAHTHTRTMRSLLLGTEDIQHADQRT